MELAAIKSQEDEQLRERIQEGLWHDGRIDAVCGNGVMSELGVGIERFREADADPRPRPSDDDASDDNFNEKNTDGERNKVDDARPKQQRSEDVEAVESMPVVVIKNFETKGGGQRKEELLDVLAQWAASLAENQVSNA